MAETKWKVSAGSVTISKTGVYYYNIRADFLFVGAGNAYTPARAGVVHAGSANKTAVLVSLNMAASVRSVSDMRDNPKTLNRSGAYIYNVLSLIMINSIAV